MVAPDLSIVIILAVVLLFYNAFMTTLVFNRRFPSADRRPLYRFIQSALVFTSALVSQFLCRLFPDPSLFLLGWFVVISILFVLDLLTRKRKNQ